jgi:hypothetical protein
VYSKSIKTVLLHKVGFELSDPVIQLNSDEQLLLSFDDLNDDKVKNYRYTIQHCDPLWKASDLFQSQYINGYPIDYIYDYKFSRNTIVSYIHYSLQFPNDNIKPILSGNYILKVLGENEDDVVLIKRFKVVEPLVRVEGNIIPAQGMQNRNQKQEISFSVFLDNLPVRNPEKDIYVVIQQNGREDNIIKGISLVRNLGKKLDYTYNRKAVFAGGNEFRSFDTKSVKYNTEFVKSIETVNDTVNFQLWEDKFRSFIDYRFSHDINGRFLIQTDDNYDAAINADYCWVHFKLPVKNMFYGGDVYLLGEVFNWKLSSETKLVYNFINKSYEGKFLLKQGYYNYCYVFVEKNKIEADLSIIEGNYFETLNKYFIYTYYKESGTYYYRLINHFSVNPN